MPEGAACAPCAAAAMRSGVLAAEITPVGEIDLIARRWGTTVFVEVKARKSAALERDAHLSVHISRIVRAAKYYIARHPALAQASLRCDVIFLAPRQWPRHVMNAFSDNAD